MPLSTANIISIVSVIGLYMGILVTFAVGMTQLWQQSEQRRREDLEDGSDSGEGEEEEEDNDGEGGNEPQSNLDPAETSTTNLDPSEPREYQSSFASTTITLPTQTGHGSSAKMLNVPNPTSIELDRFTPRPPFVRGDSAPSFFN